jgi:hypothetical protein
MLVGFKGYLKIKIKKGAEFILRSLAVKTPSETAPTEPSMVCVAGLPRKSPLTFPFCHA